MEMYSSKHYSRVDGNLKRTFYVQYVLGQMTLLEDKSASADQKAAVREDNLRSDDTADPLKP